MSPGDVPALVGDGPLEYDEWIGAPAAAKRLGIPLVTLDQIIDGQTTVSTPWKFS